MVGGDIIKDEIKSTKQLEENENFVYQNQREAIKVKLTFRCIY